MPASVVIALGSNLGDRRAHLEWAVGRLRGLVDNLRVSSFIDTAPVDVPDDQPNYLNAVVVGDTTLTPEEVLHALQALERERGRTRPSFRAARTLDLDIILFGDLVMRTPELEIPHPRYRDRAFVMEPLREIAPELITLGQRSKVKGQR
jgi:2-amino-4-hydroxy-6-hydroxymethyldihydropteridine diphosphokinase